MGRHGETLTALLSSKCPQHHQGKSQQHNKGAKANNTTLRQEPTTQQLTKVEAVTLGAWHNHFLITPVLVLFPE